MVLVYAVLLYCCTAVKKTLKSTAVYIHTAAAAVSEFRGKSSTAVLLLLSAALPPLINSSAVLL